MRFQLPTALQTELLAYDPSLKALARQKNPKTAAKKSKFPLGQPTNLIPSDVVKQSDIDSSIEEINASYAPRRFYVFRNRQNADDQQGAAHAIIYHYEKVWYAAWLPPKGKESQYLYGFSIAYKDTETCRKTLPYVIKNKYEESTESVQYGRSCFRFYQKYVTKEDIINGFTDRGWLIPCVATYHEKSRDLREAINTFEEQFKQTIPVWEDSNGLFDRLRATNTATILFESADINKDVAAKILNDDNWKPSYPSFQKLVLDHAESSGYSGDTYRYFNRILHIIDKPFFRKWIQERCDECISKANDPSNRTVRSVRRPWRLIHELLHRIHQINLIWPDCPIDYYQNHIDVLIGTRWNLNNHHGAVDWIREHMPVASFFSNLAKFYEKKAEEQVGRGQSYYYSTALAIQQFTFHDWDDICSMINTLLQHGKEVPIPRRWRIEEFHDTVQAEAWKIRNPNEKLPQDLFPEPIKIVHKESNWTFLQPHDTHQLALWGQAVRNCVGSASGYAEGVRKKKHFLVLCMVDGKPQFTVQLDVDMGTMNVRQIVGVNNQRLTPEQQAQYTAAFAHALRAQEDRLKSDHSPAASD